MKLYLYIFSFLFALLSPVWADSNRYASESVLNSGKWVKLQVSETGIYKLTFSDLKKMGFSDPAKVNVYGYGGWPIDEDFSKTYTDDLPLVPVYKGNDYLLFYGKGPVKWEYATKSGEFIHTNNPYSMYGYYFVSEGAIPTKEMEILSSEPGATLKIETFDDYKLWEKELVSVNSSGRELYGENFENTISQDFNKISIPGITNEAGKATISFIARTASGNSFVTMSIDGNDVLSSYIPAIPTTNAEYVMAREAYQTATWSGDKSENPKINIRYSKAGNKNARLNYFRLQMKRKLQPYGACTFFRSLAARINASRFVISNASADMLVLDVTDGLNPKRMETELKGTEMSFSIPASSSLREFVIVRPEQLPAPKTVGTVLNQNLHGLAQQDMIILAQPAFKEQAERLAEAHRTRDGLTVQVVEPEKVYNEFSSGTPDASAYRRFMKMFYDRKTSDADAPKYLLLFGDGSFDNRQLTDTWKRIDMSNMLLTYQTEESLNSYSYVVDDYFSFLDDAENTKDMLSRKLNIGIGRFPVRTIAEAVIAVDKVISYMNNDGAGLWKNNVCFVADDGNNGDSFDTIHQEDANNVADAIEKTNPSYVVSKVFFDAYKKKFTGGLASYPDVNTTIQKKLNDGLFLINYTGHGSATALSDENVITQNEIMQADYNSLPIWITATCDFCPFDSPATSAGESVFLNKKSGGIALFTTTRVAYTKTNANINMLLVRNLFENRTKTQTLGGVYKETKNSLGASARKLGFSLIGDPALRIAYPKYQMTVTSINGKEVANDIITLKAFDKVIVKGQLSLNGNLETTFNGTMYATVFDNRTSVNTLGNNVVQVQKYDEKGKPYYETVVRKITYDDYPNTIYNGSGVVENGKFEFSFVVPIDISYSVENFGKMSLYALDETTGDEAQGTFQNYVVRGTSDNPEHDNDPPEIKALYLNDSTFVDGGQVNSTPFFYVKTWDQTGINIVGNSIGHDIILIIDGNPSTSYVLNNYYENSTEVEGEGFVGFSIPQLTPGIHSAEFKIWDIMNNSKTVYFTFEVVEGLKPDILDLRAILDDSREYVRFYLSHNRPESNMQVAILFYDLSGRLLWKHEESGSSSLFDKYIVDWNLITSSGSKLKPGIYLYRAAISSNGSKEASKAKKIVILR